MNDALIFNHGARQPVYFEDETDSHMQRGLVTRQQPHSIQEQPDCGPYQDYQSKLYSSYEKDRMQLYKKAAVLEQNIHYQEFLAELKAKNSANKLLTSSEIYTDSGDRLIYLLKKPDTSNLASRELLNARGYRAFIYYSGYPYAQAVLAVSWNYGEHVVYFPYGIDTSPFIRKLNSHGLRLMVSGRMQKDAGSALLAYSVDNAEKIEIPFDYGWWMDMERKWHFARKDEKNIIMKEICKKNEW